MQSGFDINRLRQEAQTRWLKPSEVLYILQNHEKYPLTDQPPKQPPSGSLFLFNRRVLRFFRKDGHLWRKKKDGRTIGEAHERLKVGSVDTLNCYYAHGEKNPYFQRRSYWMLDPAYEHIVLVHYREVAEGRFISGSISNWSTDSCSTFCQNSSMNSAQLHGFTSGSSELYEPYQDSCSPASVEEVSSKVGINNLNAVNKSGDCDPSQMPGVNQALKRLAEQLSLDDDDDLNHFVEKLPPDSIENGGLDDQGSIEYEVRDSEQESPQNPLGLSDYRDHYKVEGAGDQEGCRNIQFLDISGNNGRQPSHSVCGHGIERKDSPSWKDMLELSSDSTENAIVRTSNLLALDGVQAQKLTWNQPDCNGHGAENNHNGSQNPGSDLCLQLSETKRFLLGSDTLESPSLVSHVPEIERPFYYNPDTSILEANSGLLMPRRENNAEWMLSMQLAVDNNTYSSDFSGMWFDQSLLENSLAEEPSLTVAQKQQFSIREVSPEWAFSLESTKVIITGDFLCNPSECLWAIMFGDIEVPLEIVQEGVLRCQAPIRGPGKVALCVTAGNRESCSQLWEFEFRANPTASGAIDTSPQAGANKSEEEILLLARFAHILLCGNDNLLTPRGNVGAENEPSRKFRMTDDQWAQFIKVLCRGGQNPSVTVEWIMQELLKDKFQQWLLSKHQKSRNEGSDCLLSRKEQCVIHMISGLGYEWALGPILSSGVGLNFRDMSGWTALHWAAQFGREKMIAALLAAGASAGAVTDPTSHDPAGKNAAAIAAAHGHKGLAGYLSEAALTSHLSSLTLEESEISKGSAALEAEKAVETVRQMSFQIPVGGTEDQLYLEAVRKSTLAAARIQAAFRAHSFRKRQQEAALSQDEYGMTLDDIHGLSAASKSFRAIHGFRDQKLNKAAVSIQKKYRGWKGRKDFLTLRQNVVKIQAHFRGHQVRKNYKEMLWAVNVLEKAILRWRRKGVGLRGYRAEPESMDEEENDDIVKVFRKTKVDAALDEGLSRVLSMVESPVARQQYCRMLERYCQAKAKLSNVDETTSRFQWDLELNENDDLGMYHFT